jgi:hypothetical protein
MQKALKVITGSTGIRHQSQKALTKRSRQKDIRVCRNIAPADKFTNTHSVNPEQSHDEVDPSIQFILSTGTIDHAQGH